MDWKMRYGGNLGRVRGNEWPEMARKRSDYAIVEREKGREHDNLYGPEKPKRYNSIPWPYSFQYNCTCTVTIHNQPVIKLPQNHHLIVRTIPTPIPVQHLHLRNLQARNYGVDSPARTKKSRQFSPIRIPHKPYDQTAKPNKEKERILRHYQKKVKCASSKLQCTNTHQSPSRHFDSLSLSHKITSAPHTDPHNEPALGVQGRLLHRWWWGRLLPGGRWRRRAFSRRTGIVGIRESIVARRPRKHPRLRGYTRLP